jgi:hypothetical protein
MTIFSTVWLLSYTTCSVLIDVILRRVRVAIVAVEKQLILRILGVCLTLVIQHEMRLILIMPSVASSVHKHHTSLTSVLGGNKFLSLSFGPVVYIVNHR